MIMLACIGALAWLCTATNSVDAIRRLQRQCRKMSLVRSPGQQEPSLIPEEPKNNLAIFLRGRKATDGWCGEAVKPQTQPIG